MVTEEAGRSRKLGDVGRIHLDGDGSAFSLALHAF